MAARRARRGGKKHGKTNLTPLFIGVGIVLVLAIIMGSGLFKKGTGARTADPTPNFRISDYRRDGSRFASTGNLYVFDGRIENIETIGNDRIVCISLPDRDNLQERLPLLVPGNRRLSINLTRGDRFLFETTCTTGKTADGKQVKGVLVVKNAKTR